MYVIIETGNRNRNRLGIRIISNESDEGKYKIIEVKKAILSLMSIDTSLIQLWIEREKGFGTVLQDDNIVEAGDILDFTIKSEKPDLVGTFKI